MIVVRSLVLLKSSKVFVVFSATRYALVFSSVIPLTSVIRTSAPFAKP